MRALAKEYYCGTSMPFQQTVPRGRSTGTAAVAEGPQCEAPSGETTKTMRDDFVEAPAHPLSQRSRS